MGKARSRVGATARVAFAAALSASCSRSETPRAADATPDGGSVASNASAAQGSFEGAVDGGQCAPGVRRCSDGRSQTCGASYQWSAVVACGAGQTCSDGRCEARPSLMLFGGSDSTGHDLLDTWTFDGVRWKQVAASTPTAAPDRFKPLANRPALTALDDEIVLFGGTLQDVWTLDGATWTRPAISNAPPARVLWASATFGREIVLFGGETSNSDLRDTWIFNGTTWRQLTVADAPPRQIGASMATLGDKVVLFGNVGHAGSTWIFDGTNWTHLSVARSPSERIGAAIAALGDQIVLFGGDVETPSGLAQDTWVFDGKGWKQVNVSTPPPARAWASMATLGNESVLFGGTGELGAMRQDTWAFDGTRWRQVSVPNHPPPRAYAALGRVRTSP